jgi:hypothetical protein
MARQGSANRHSHEKRPTFDMARASRQSGYAAWRVGGEVRSGFQCNQDEGPRGSDVVKGSRMAVIDPSEPNAGTKKGGKVREPAHRVIHCWREGLVFLRSGRSSTASPCRSRSADFLVPTGALTLAPMMQPKCKQIRADVEARYARTREWKGLEISRKGDVIPGRLVRMKGL